MDKNENIKIVQDEEYCYIFADTHPDNPPSFEKAKEVRDEYVKKITLSEDEQAYDNAMSYIYTQDFGKCISALEKVILKYPDWTSAALNSIGACYFYMKKYELALEYYQKSLASSGKYEKEMVDNNIWEVCEKLYQIKGDHQYIQKYLDHFPEGKEKSAALKILGHNL